ncbi:MAG: hypothetical protein KF884_02805 [Fimbriimonadaceae bacterium]|nr:hypothetical protein [Fimbriimonadaceae bacterium]QYK59026.1 MAG: hypothetical protein KF884_02805 [Fimbriimonadaceae bacterium]
MTANDVLVRQLERQLESFIKTFEKVPADKLEWAPEGCRSALDQGQEVATVIGDHWELYESRKMVWSEEAFSKWLKARAQLKSREQIVARLKLDTQKLIEYTRSLPANDLMAPTEMPFQGEFRMVDNITYHTWNMSYHEGQINMILMMLGIDPMGG